MKLLVDANISFRIIKALGKNFSEVIHVSRTGLPLPAKDLAIWKWAKENDCIIVTHDEDFVRLLTLYGFPPKLILLKTGNQRTNYLAQSLTGHQKDIERLYESKDEGLLEIM